MGLEAQRRGQRPQLSGDQAAQRHQRAVALEPLAHRAHGGRAARELVGDQADDTGQRVVDEIQPPAQPTQGAGKLDRVIVRGAAHLVRRLLLAARLLRRHNNRFQRIERARQPRRQTVGQKADGRMALTAIPARNLRAGRGLPLVGAVACHRTSAVRVIRAALKPCFAPRLGLNVFLAGKPRFVAKLHRPWPGGSSVPRASLCRSARGRDYGRSPAPPSCGAVDASCGPIGVLRTVWTAHGQAGACPQPDHTRRSRAHRSTASTAIRILLRIKKSAAVSALPALGHRPGKSANQSKRENTPRFYPARSKNNTGCSCLWLGRWPPRVR